MAYAASMGHVLWAAFGEDRHQVRLFEEDRTGIALVESHRPHLLVGPTGQIVREEWLHQWTAEQVCGYPVFREGLCPSMAAFGASRFTARPQPEAAPGLRERCRQ